MSQANTNARVWNAATYAKAPRRAYSKPTGTRLQLSGQWLTDSGFKPGDTYTVKAKAAGLRVEVAQGNATVTASHGEAKLYVAAEALPMADRLEVLRVAPGKLLVRPAR